MSTHIERMVAELDDLSERADKLFAFFSNSIFFGLDDQEKDRMRMQYYFMCRYRDVLTDRIDFAEGK
jgi:hypothetical protein